MHKDGSLVLIPIFVIYSSKNLHLLRHLNIYVYIFFLLLFSIPITCEISRAILAEHIHVGNYRMSNHSAASHIEVGRQI